MPVEATEKTLPSLVEKYLATISEAEEEDKMLTELERIIDTLEYIHNASPESLKEAYPEAQRLLELLKIGRTREAYEGSVLVCKLSCQAFLASILRRDLEADMCVEKRVLELLDKVLEAAGPLKPLLVTMVGSSASKVSDVITNLAGIASSWRQLSKVLTEIYRSAVYLERSIGLKRSHVVSLAISSVEGRKPKDALAVLDHLSSLLSNAVASSRRLARLLTEASEATQSCRSFPNTMPCRFVNDLLSRLVTARTELEKATGSSLEALAATIASIEKKVREAEKEVRNLFMFASRLDGKEPGSLDEAINKAMLLLRKHEATPEEEDVVLMLVKGVTIDIMDLHKKNPRYSRAALKLCTKGLAQCTVTF